MTKNRKETDIRTRYEFLIAGIVAIVLCIFAFAAFKITSYMHAANAPDSTETTVDPNSGTVLIEVEIRETAGPDETATETSETAPENEVVQLAVNEHDDIHVFTVTTPGDNYYKTKDGRLPLYAEPKDTDEDRPSLNEDTAFEVLGFSRDGWAAIDFGGQRYYVKSAGIIKATAPEDAVSKHKNPVDSQSVRFFTPNSGDVEYVVNMDTKGFNLPDVESTGNSIDLKRGERVIVVAKGGNWLKIIYMNGEYYILDYVDPRAKFVEENPDVEIIDNTGYAPAGTPEAVRSATSAGAADTARSDGIPSGHGTSGNGTAGTTDPTDPNNPNNPNNTTDPSNPTDPTNPTDPNGSAEPTEPEEPDEEDPYEEANATAPSGYAREILTLTNEVRREAGVAPLEWDYSLANCASIRAAELPQLTYEQNVQHLRPDGSAWYTVNEDLMYAENIAYGQSSAESVFNEWLSSSGHYENMINSGYRTFAVALYETSSGYYYYWIEEFGY